jgi:hypothetical protein
MDKTQALAAIEALPLFRFRDVAVEDELPEPDSASEAMVDSVWVKVSPQFVAVTEVGRTEPLAFPSDHYKLVQFKEVFKPIVESFEEQDCFLSYNHGFAVLDIFPSLPKEDGDSYTIGVGVYNSVDTTCAVQVKFQVYDGKRIWTMPQSITSFRRVHVGQVGMASQDYLAVIAKVQAAWKNIVALFTKVEVDKDNFDDLCKSFAIPDRMRRDFAKRVRTGSVVGWDFSKQKIDMWKLCMAIFDELSSHRFKSAIHKRKHLDKFVESILSQSMRQELLAAC